MKQLQNNFTTPEQSKRLMDLGVPADSADCYTTMTQTDIIIHVWHSAEGYSLTLSKFLEEMEVTPSYRAISFYPCWSVGRLMEIYLTCALDYHPYDDFYTETPSLHFMAFDKDRLIDEIIEMISEDEMDFSKLED